MMSKSSKSSKTTRDLIKTLDSSPQVQRKRIGRTMTPTPIVVATTTTTTLTKRISKYSPYEKDSDEDDNEMITNSTSRILSNSKSQLKKSPSSPSSPLTSPSNGSGPSPSGRLIYDSESPSAHLNGSGLHGDKSHSLTKKKKHIIQVEEKRCNKFGFFINSDEALRIRFEY